MEKTNVVICGGGPTGAVLSALLGALGVPNVVLEREKDITTDPRGIALDEDGIRVLQSIGLYDRIYTEIGSSMGIFNFVTGTEADLMKPPLLAIDYTTLEGGTGHVGFICHKQPAMEKAIRDRIAEIPSSEIRTQSTVTAISEDQEQVYVEYTDSNGKLRKLQADFLIGADDLPNETTHPDFPLWRLGHTPQNVFDLFFPEQFRFLCNPQRPSVCGRFGLPEDRLWRFEFVVRKGEDSQVMATDLEIHKIIGPYITHPGSRYGLKHPVRYPADCIQTLRSRPFNFSARSCNKWALGRVILVGDAAHVFPPFGGQGIVSGFRDASALAWRLALLQRHPSADHERILTAWYTERKQQLEKSLAATVVNGRYVTESDPLKVFLREWYMWTIQLIPSWRREIEKGPRAQGMARYQYTAGLPFIANMDGGLLLPQVFAYNFQSDSVHFTDDLIFAPSKQSLFQLLILSDSTKEVQSLTAGIEQVTNVSQGLLSAQEATVIIQSCSAILRPQETPSYQVSRIATGDEFANDSTLCRGRPPPKGYDELRIRKEIPGKAYVIVRQDRFVFAACRDVSELVNAARQLPAVLCSNYTYHPTQPRPRL